MVSIVKTDEIVYDANKTTNNALICISRKNTATQLLINWEDYDVIPWEKYEIKETDMRVKTATFTSPQYLDLTTGQYCVLITSKLHEDFGGVVLKVEKTVDGLYNYTCQDFSRSYQSKVDTVLCGDVTVHRYLQRLLTKANIPIKGKITKAMKKQWSKQLSGLRPAYQYEQKYWGSTINFNPMTQKPLMMIRNVTEIEAIRDLVFGSGAYIDVYIDKYGIIHIEPYTKDEFFNTGLVLTTPEIATNFKRTFDTTNIITTVRVHDTDKFQSGNSYSSQTLTGLNLCAFFGNVGASIDNPNKDTTTTKNTGKGTSKKATTAKTNNDNPYGKKKVVWINSDNINGPSSDRKFMNDVAAILKKHGWKTKIVGLGPNTHTEGYMGPKNGIWFCIYGGADGAVFRECATKNSYTNKLKSLGSRTVIGMHGGGDIRKGGQYYKFLPRAHDDNYSPSSYRGISYPLNMLTKAKVPIGYASDAKQMAAKFLAGMDNPKAC